MKLLSKIWRFSVKCGASLFLLSIMFAAAVSLVSITQKGKVYYGDRCCSILNPKAIDFLNQKEIIAYDYELNCNTLYLDLNVQDELSKDQIVALLIKISNYYKELKISNNTQATIKNSSYLILANLANDGSLSLSVTQI